MYFLLILFFSLSAIAGKIILNIENFHGKSAQKISTKSYFQSFLLNNPKTASAYEIFLLKAQMVNENPLDIIKNAFHFTLKALFVLKIINFGLDFLVILKNGLMRKVRLILKFMTSKRAKQAITIHILPNI